jgi:hypothetical protein
MKTCNKCFQQKEYSDFDHDSSRKDGYYHTCKSCRRRSKRPIPRLGFKYCTKCKRELLLSEFTKNQKYVYSKCKTCINKTVRRKAPPVKVGYKWCGGCRTEKQLSEFYSDSSRTLGVSSRCKSCVLKEIIKYGSRKFHFDSNFKILKLLRGRVRSALKGKTKSAQTLKLIGCSIEQLKEHLQNTAISNGYKNFNINNYSGKEYHIDHIVPCVTFNLKCSFHQRLCFNWSNLQILKSSDNIRKSNN